MGQIDCQRWESEVVCLTLGSQYVLVSFVRQIIDDIKASQAKALERRARQLARLERMEEIGMAVAEMLGEKALSGEMEPEVCAEALSKVTRFTRLSMSLANKIADEQEKDLQARMVRQVKADNKRGVGLELDHLVRSAVRRAAKAAAEKGGRDLASMKESLQREVDRECLWSAHEMQITEATSRVVERVCRRAKIPLDWHLFTQDDWFVDEQLDDKEDSLLRNGTPLPVSWHVYGDAHLKVTNPDTEPVSA